MKQDLIQFTQDTPSYYPLSDIFEALWPRWAILTARKTRRQADCITLLHLVKRNLVSRLSEYMGEGVGKGYMLYFPVLISIASSGLGLLLLLFADVYRSVRVRSWHRLRHKL